MNIKETIRQRREITHYLEKPISEEELQQLLNAGYLSPTGNNLPSREFVLITNRAMLEHLALSTPFVPWLAEAQAAIVITGRPSVSKYWLQDASCLRVRLAASYRSWNWLRIRCDLQCRRSGRSRKKRRLCSCCFAYSGRSQNRSNIRVWIPSRNASRKKTDTKRIQHSC